MKHQTLKLGSILTAGIIAVALCVCMVSGYVNKPFISVDPISDQNIGNPFTITGTTSLPAGSVLLVEVYPASFQNATGTGSGEFYGASGIVSVTAGSGNIHAWSMALNTTKFSPGTYLVKTSLFEGNTQKDDFTTGEPTSTVQFTLN